MMRALFAPLSLSLAARARSVRRARAAPPAQIFSKYDADSSNTIDLQELTLALTDLFGKCPYSAEELNALVAQVDENANGELEYAEFLALAQLIKEQRALTNRAQSSSAPTTPYTKDDASEDDADSPASEPRSSPASAPAKQPAKDFGSLLELMRNVSRRAEQLPAAVSKELLAALQETTEQLSAVGAQSGVGGVSASRELAAVCTTVLRIDDLLDSSIPTPPASSQSARKPKAMGRAEAKAVKAQAATFASELRARCTTLSTREGYSPPAPSPTAPVNERATASRGAAEREKRATSSPAEPVGAAPARASAAQMSASTSSSKQAARMSASTSSSKQGTVLAGDRHLFLRHDFRSARAAYESAAAENDAQAWLMLGVMAQAGLGTSADVEHAKECLEKAAVASDVGEVGIPGGPVAFAKNWLGAIWVRQLLDIEGAPSQATRAVSKALLGPAGVQSWPASPTLVRDLDWLRRIMPKDESVAPPGAPSRELCAKHLSEAHRLFEAAASDEPDFLAPLTNLAVVCEMQRKLEDALKWYSRAAALGEPSAQNRMGALCHSGWPGLAQDASMAVSWFRKAMQGGDTDAHANLALLHEYGHGGLRRDRVRATALFRTAAERVDGSPHAMGHLGYLLAHDALQIELTSEAERKHARHQMTEAFGWLRRAADAGIAEAAFHLGQLYENDRSSPVVVRDPMAALASYSYAADLPGGHPSAAARAAEMLFAGTAVPADPALAAAFYLMAARGGHVESMNALGIFHEEGLAGLPIDIRAALDWFTRAANGASCTAAFNLGSLYRTLMMGGVAKMPACLAAVTPPALPAEAVGEFFKTGGVSSVSTPQEAGLAAVSWFEKAAELGHALAMHEAARTRAQLCLVPLEPAPPTKPAVTTSDAVPPAAPPSAVTTSDAVPPAASSPSPQVSADSPSGVAPVSPEDYRGPSSSLDEASPDPAATKPLATSSGEPDDEAVDEGSPLSTSRVTSQASHSPSPSAAEMEADAAASLGAEDDAELSEDRGNPGPEEEADDREEGVPEPLSQSTPGSNHEDSPIPLATETDAGADELASPAPLGASLGASAISAVPASLARDDSDTDSDAGGELASRRLRDALSREDTTAPPPAAAPSPNPVKTASRASARVFRLADDLDDDDEGGELEVASAAAVAAPPAESPAEEVGEDDDEFDNDF